MSDEEVIDILWDPSETISEQGEVSNHIEDSLKISQSILNVAAEEGDPVNIYIYNYYEDEEEQKELIFRNDELVYY
ncbi:hypothetical protein [Enterococcus alishanensis]